MKDRVEIAALAARGEGIARLEGGEALVPFTLPGEHVEADMEDGRGELLEVLQAAPERVPAPCRHFGTCGGCMLQHMAAPAYLAWKRRKVVDALAARGIDAPVGEIIVCPPHARRRVVLAARRTEAGMILGYSRMRSHHLIDIEECPITRRAIVEALAKLRELAELICNTTAAFRLAVTASETGLDIDVHGAGPLSEAARHAVSRFAIAARFARVSHDGEIVIEPAKPAVTVAGVAVHPPPGAFFQAVAEAEQAMADEVCAHLGKAKNVADLFSGWGSFALRLARTVRVHAVEADAPALAALDRAFRASQGLKPVTVERRDLFRRPLTAKELAAYDGLVFDPPRAGAEAQARQIAKSGIPRIAAVSCNPVTLARDLAILVEGGYRIAGVTPVDQFLWSGHVEAVALLEKPRKRR